MVEEPNDDPTAVLTPVEHQEIPPLGEARNADGTLMTPAQWRVAAKKSKKEMRLAQIQRMNLMKQAKKKRRLLVEEKVRQNLPITDEERSLLSWGGNATKEKNRQKIIEQAAQLVIKPKNVEALRLVVESTAAKHGYNPVESLIKLSVSGDLEDKEKVAIHKALLPFLVPQIPAAKEKQEVSDENKIKVTIAQFVIPDHARQRPEKPIYEDKPPVVTEKNEDTP